MSAEQPRRLAALRRILASWYAPAAAGLLLLIAAVVWVLPRRVEGIVTDAATGESRTVTAWNTSRWQAVSAYWWQALLLALVLVVLLAVAWCGRGWVLRAAAAARFFAASVFVHGLLVLWLCAVPLARAVVEHAEVIRKSQTAHLFEEARPSRSGGQPAFEKLADLRAEQRVAPALVRQDPSPASLPESTDPVTPTIPAHAVRSLPPQRLLFVSPRQEVVRVPQEIDRRGADPSLKPIEIPFDTPAPLPPEAAPKEKPLDGRAVAQARQEPAIPAPLGLDSPRLPELKRPHPADLRPKAPRPPQLPQARQVPELLSGRRPAARMAPAMPHEPEAALKAEALPAEKPPDVAGITLPRLAPPPLLPVRIPDDLTGPSLPLKQPAAAVTPSPRPDVATRFAPLVSRLPRTQAGPGRVAKVEDRAAPPPTLLLRQKEVRQRSVELFGGTRASEAAVERGLDWLAAHQNGNGSWSLNNFHANCKHPRCADAGTANSDPAGTGIALLPFLGAGTTHQTGKHQATVARALAWLVRQQRPDGTWPAPHDARPMYGHGMASIALCEAYGMTRDAHLREPAERALAYIVKAQHAPSGGWRYRPNQPADTSVVGWQLMALKSGEMAGLSVPSRVFEGVKRWLASVEANKPVGGLFGYQSTAPTPAMTGQGLLCLQYLGTRRDDPRMRAGTDYLLKHLPRVGSDTSYYWYHATQVMYHVQGKAWKAWNGRLRDMLVSSQAVRGTLAGSWTPVDAREKPGGRVYATALRLLMLEVYYRHLPLYQQLEK